jgi:hypothetical protein
MMGVDWIVLTAIESYNKSLRRLFYIACASSHLSLRVMGQCVSAATPEQRQALEASRRIDAENDRDFRAQRGVIRLLLLGAGESGKSTVFKQIRMLYGSVGALFIWLLHSLMLFLSFECCTRFFSGIHSRGTLRFSPAHP